MPAADSAVVRPPADTDAPPAHVQPAAPPAVIPAPPADVLVLTKIPVVYILNAGQHRKRMVLLFLGCALLFDSRYGYGSGLAWPDWLRSEPSSRGSNLEHDRQEAKPPLCGACTASCNSNEALDGSEAAVELG